MTVISESLQGLRAMVVEDELLIAEEIRERLTRHGLKVVAVVDTGDGAIDMAERCRPELVLMDIRLKGPIDGIRAAQVIRACVQAPVVFLTAHSDQDTLRRAMASDPFGYVLKPLNDRELVVAIDMALHRHRLEQRLKESERRYAATLSSIGDAVVATDREGKVTFMNPVAETMTGWRFADARGLAVDRVLPLVLEKTGDQLENPTLRALRERKTLTLDQPSALVSQSGEAVPIDDSAAPIMDERGEMLGAVMAFRDIRQRRLAEDALSEAQERLRQAQRMEAIGRLAGGVAHDFNNLLMVISGSTDLLLGGEGLSPSAQSLLQDIRRAAQQAAGLTGRLLAFGRKQILRPVELDLGKLIADLSRMLVRIIGEDVLFTAKCAKDLWRLRADPGQIEQVLLNLAVNSRDAMPTGGKLEIEARNETVAEGQVHDRPELLAGRYVVLSVTDTGSGMDVETRRHAFEPFFTTKEAGKGTGLGLATSYGIVKQSDGFIYLDSAPGQGTTVTLYFPAIVEPDSAAPEGAAAKDPQGGDETILLVEDDRAVRSLIASALRQRGYTVLDTSHGEEALARFDEHADSIALVLSDVVMPGMSGREVIEKVRERRPSIRCIFLSGYTDDQILHHGARRGEVAFLMKPFTMRELAEKVREVLDA